MTVFDESLRWDGVVAELIGLAVTTSAVSNASLCCLLGSCASAVPFFNLMTSGQLSDHDCHGFRRIITVYSVARYFVKPTCFAVVINRVFCCPVCVKLASFATNTEHIIVRYMLS